MNYDRVYRLWRREELASIEFAMLCRHNPAALVPRVHCPHAPWVYRFRGYRVGKNEREAELMPCLPVQPPASALGSLPSVALSSARASTILQ